MKNYWLNKEDINLEQALKIIQELKIELAVQREEFEEVLEEGYAEAYEELTKLRMENKLLKDPKFIKGIDSDKFHWETYKI